MKDQNLMKIMEKLASMETTLPEIKSEIVDLKTRLLDPDAGLYTRVKDLRVWSAEASKDFASLQERIEESEDQYLKKEEKIYEALEKIKEKMEPLAEYEAQREKRKKWIEKIVWVIVPIVIAAITKGIFSVIDIQDMLQKQQNRQKDSVTFQQ